MYSLSLRPVPDSAENAHSRSVAKAPACRGGRPNNQVLVVRSVRANPARRRFCRHQPFRRDHCRRSHHLSGRDGDACRDCRLDDACGAAGERGSSAHRAGRAATAVTQHAARAIALRASCPCWRPLGGGNGSNAWSPASAADALDNAQSEQPAGRGKSLDGGALAAAPSWFARLVGPPIERHQVPVTIGGNTIAKVEITSQPEDEIDEVWDNSVALAAIAGAAAIVLVAASLSRAWSRSRPAHRSGRRPQGS